VISLQRETKAYQGFSVSLSLIPLLLLSIMLGLSFYLFTLSNRRSILAFEEIDPCLKYNDPLL
jgi:hypothetical protein